MAEDIKDKLRALLANKGVMTGSDWQARMDEVRAKRESGAFEVDKIIVPGELVGEAGAGFYRVRREYPLDHEHGSITLGSVLETNSGHVALSACDDELAEFDPRRAAFVDIETAGLAGGTGVVAFLIGIGYFDEDGFRVEQCFMRDYDDEEPMLEYLAPLLGRFESVVTYNGKSFDVPLLRTRFITNRQPFRLDGIPHFDLLHASRRFWKVRLKDCSLGNIERSVLGLKRHGDVRSAEVPQLWFDYLRTRDARPIECVFTHHCYDILSLVGLTAWLSRCLESPEGEGFEHLEDRYSLVRLHHRQKRFLDVVSHAKRLLESVEDEFVRRETYGLLSDAYKRLEDFERMRETCDRMLMEFPKDLQARLELAKLHEHRTRNLGEAKRICAETIAILELRETVGRELGFADIGVADFRHRLARIERKLSRNRLPGDEEE
ncbi:MAG: ribonuclease H-like domain-containing protein [FCB group bacterium]|jgi:uncharacterized protein YprB with RNaseH-like and TPR domain|nr:ribonuclease H-like domain-containing protein [FCB group bacterium]